MATEVKQCTGNDAGLTQNWNVEGRTNGRIDDPCSDETPGCVEGGSGAWSDTFAIIGTASSGSVFNEAEFGDTTYDRVSQVDLHLYAGVWTTGSALENCTIQADSTLFNDQKVIGAGGGWQSCTWIGSWSKAEINAMVIQIIAVYTGYDQPAIAASFIVYTEEAGGSSSSSYSSESSYSSYSSESSDSSISSISSISSNSSGSSSSYSSLSSESSNSSESSEELGTGEVCWGHDTAVEEFNIRDFTGNITDGSGYRIVGSNDDERIEFELGGYIELETWQFGVMLCKLTRDKYQFGSGNITIKYKNGDGESNCEADTWHTYSIPFACTGWIKVRIESN